MANRTCYVHVGTGKTGTSAIQYALTTARDNLASLGFLYPDISRDFKKVVRGEPTAGNASAILKTLKNGGGGGEQTIALLRPFAERPENLVLSCEGFSNVAPPRLEAFVRGLESLGYDVKCLVLFRPQAEMIVSKFLQHVKTRKNSMDTLSDYVEQMLRSNKLTTNWNWYGRAQKLDAAFGENNVTVKWYPSLIRHDSRGVVKTTFEWLGVTLRHDHSDDRNTIINPTPGREALMILEQLNSQGLGGKNFSDKFLLRAQREGLLGRRVILNPALLQKVESATRESNIQLLERYCPELSVHDELRSSPENLQAGEVDPKKMDKLKKIASDILQSRIQAPVKHGGKQMEVTKLIDQMRRMNPNLLDGIPENKAEALIKGVFRHMNNALAGAEEGVVNFADLGRFRVRKVEKEVDGKKVSHTQITFRRAEAGGGVRGLASRSRREDSGP